MLPITQRSSFNSTLFVDISACGTLLYIFMVILLKMKTKKVRQHQLNKSRLLLKDDDSAVYSTSSELEQPTEYSTLHDQSQVDSPAIKNAQASADEKAVVKNKKPVQLFTQKNRKPIYVPVDLNPALDVVTENNKFSKTKSEKDNNEKSVKISGKALIDEEHEDFDEDEFSGDEKYFDSDESEEHDPPPLLKTKLTNIPDTEYDVEILDDDIKDNLFSSLLARYGVSKWTRKRMDFLEFVNMTEFQRKTIPALLEGRDLLARLTPGCGKVAAYLIPAIEILLKLNFKSQHGTGIIILLPTQELIRDVYDLIKLILKPHPFNCFTLMSGNAKEHETENLRQGVNFILCTPGHLLHHMHNALVFKYSNVQYLVIDEADRVAELGLHFELSQILDLLPKRRQTLLFARNINKRTLEIAEYCLKKTPLFVDAEDKIAVKYRSELQCLLCPTEQRLSFLYTFLRSKREKKVVVLFSSCLSAQYHYDILNYLNMTCLGFHGKQSILKNKQTYSEFTSMENGVLLCTNAAALDLDISQCDWILQYEPPDDVTEFYKRRGRVVGHVGSSTEALLLLRPEEKGFFSRLRKANVPFKEVSLPISSLLKIENEVEPSVKSMYFLHKSSRDGYMAFIKAYASHHLTSIFDVKTLNLVKVAKSFGFAIPPYVDFDVHYRQAVKVIKRKQLNNKEKTIYASKKPKKSKHSKHLRFRVPKTKN